MISEGMRYYGSPDSREIVELDEVRSDGMYITSCAVSLDLLLSGISVFTCENGEDLKLEPEQQLKILEFAQVERKMLTDRELEGLIEELRREVRDNRKSLLN